MGFPGVVTASRMSSGPGTFLKTTSSFVPVPVLLERLFKCWDCIRPLIRAKGCDYTEGRNDTKATSSLSCILCRPSRKLRSSSTGPSGPSGMGTLEVSCPVSATRSVHIVLSRSTGETDKLTAYAASDLVSTTSYAVKWNNCFLCAGARTQNFVS
eukprot:4640832-Amphidinium_carterae.1